MHFWLTAGGISVTTEVLLRDRDDSLSLHTTRQTARSISFSFSFLFFSAVYCVASL
jgi:hypothetical protein